jgi:hypothetical protein
MKSLAPYLLFVFFSTLSPLVINGQTNHGFTFDNYGGIYNVTANPANSVESKHRFHVNALSFNRWNVSDFGAVDLLNIQTAPNGFNGLDFPENNTDGTNKNVMLSNSDVLLPSLLWGFHEKHAVGLIWRSRTFSDYQSFNGSLWSTLNGQTPIAGIAGESTFKNTVHHWDEIGLNYALVVINSNYHFLKFGGTIKYLSGRGGVEISGSINSNETGETVNRADFSYLNTFDNNIQNLNTSEKSLFISNAFNFPSKEAIKGTGIGGDVGLVYEWRPRETNRTGRNSSSGVNVYKLRISAAILDLGSISYGKKNENIELRNFDVTTQNEPISTSNVNDFFDGLDDNNNAQPPQPPIQQGSVTFALPRSLNIGLDYILFNDKNYYINLNYRTGLNKITDDYANTPFDLITLTPRYETRDFSVYLPISYEKNTGIYAGLGIRYKYITAGCAALNTFIQDQPLNHIYVGLSLPILEEVF